MTLAPFDVPTLLFVLLGALVAGSACR